MNIGRIAQRLEQGTHNALVQGSNPCVPKKTLDKNANPVKLKQ